ncbi:uncharacterized protein LOC143365366 isoform X1 [Halictus rubicundus]|uniref:uncharacterized protein LOC143365366 isoform X1 n=1 Tax=Halictus rubicundus TaxID=77578 RepID=UPI00403602D7
MEEFKEIHGDIYQLLCFTGLWPVHDSQFAFRMMAKRFLIPTITLACLVIQYKTLTSVELTLENVLSTMSFSGPMVLFFVRYMSFLLAFSTIRKLFMAVQNDFVIWKNTIEMDMFNEYIQKAKVLYYYYLRLVSFTVISMSLAMIPIITQKKLQAGYLRYFGFYYAESSIKTTCVCFQILFVYGIGIFCVLGTEASMSVCSHHICGLLKITSYKITTTINDVAKSTTAKTVNIAPAIKLHLHAIDMMDSISQDLGLSYLVTIGTAVVSFSLNLCRIFLVLVESNHLDEAVVPFLIILSHVIMIFLGNHCGQTMSNTSLEVFNAAYNSFWYYIPLNARKLVAFIMMRSAKELECNFLSLYTAGYEGCSMMLSTSFSYFTVLYSVH